MSRHNLFGQPKFPAQQVHHFQNVTLLLFVTAGKLPLRRAHVYGRGRGEPHGELTAVTSILPGTNLQLTFFHVLQLICPPCNQLFAWCSTHVCRPRFEPWSKARPSRPHARDCQHSSHVLQHSLRKSRGRAERFFHKRLLYTFVVHNEFPRHPIRFEKLVASRDS